MVSDRLKTFSILERIDNCTWTVHSFLCVLYLLEFLYVPILALSQLQNQYVQACTQGKRSPVRDCLKRIRIRLINSVTRSHLPVGQARNEVTLLFKDMTSAHSNCFSGQKVEHKAKIGVSEWTELLEEGTEYKINL